ncbi:hypothetical protein MMC07_008890, partial [Pseudocyphellaria aurata]|nr:hypothetical protein [Pseudocyphellaria aurata]
MSTPMSKRRAGRKSGSHIPETETCPEETYPVRLFLRYKHVFEVIHLRTSKKIKLKGFDLAQASSSVDFLKLAQNRLAPQLAMGRCETVGDSMAYGNGHGLGLLQELKK